VRGNEIGRLENTLTSASSPGSTNTTLQPPEPLHGHGTCTHPSTHGASVGFLGLEGSCHRPRDRRGASRSQRQPAATLDARCEHPRQRGQLNPTQEPSAQRGDGWLEHAGRGQTAGLLGGIVPPVIVDEGMGARRHPAPVPRHGAEVLPPPGGAVEGKRSQPDGGRQAQSAEHARARAGLRGLRGGRRPPCDRREAPRRQRQPPDPAADTCEHGGRCQPNPLLEPPAAARGRGPRACQAWAKLLTFRRDLTARGPS